MHRIELDLVAAALVKLAAAIGAPAAVRLNLPAYRLLGLEDFAGWWERRLDGWTAVVRAVAAGATFNIAIVLLIREWP